MFLIFKTDNWHSYSSRDLIGLATEENDMFRLIKEQVEKEGCNLSPADHYNIGHIHQTQNYEGEGEFDIDIVEVGKLL